MRLREYVITIMKHDMKMSEIALGPLKNLPERDGSEDTIDMDELEALRLAEEALRDKAKVLIEGADFIRDSLPSKEEVR